MDTDGPRFDEPVTVRFAPEIAELTVGESSGRRFSRWTPFPGRKGDPGLALTMREYLPEGSGPDAILDAVS